MRRIPLLLALAATLTPSYAQTPSETDSLPVSARIRITTSTPWALAQRLSAQGFDAESLQAAPGSVELIVAPSEYDGLRELGLPIQVLEYGRPFDEIQRERQVTDGVPTGYPDLATVNAAMATAEANFPAICKRVDLAATYGPGSTYENRPLWAVKISDNVQQDEDEPNMLIVCAYHVRELVTPVIALNAIDELTSGYASNPAVQAAVNSHEIWIVPVSNPDGYEYVFNFDNFWRKNRHPYGSDFGVDLNRNHAMGWSSSCSGSTTTSFSTYKGPFAESEEETQSIVGLSNERRFAKVLDFHSSGRETLYSYRCSSYPTVLDTWLQTEADALSTAAGYGNASRLASAEGEHYQWQLNAFGSHSFLTETHSSFQPSYSSAQTEADAVWGEILFMLQKPIPLTGHVADSMTGAPISADIDVSGFVFTEGEKRQSGGSFGSYFYWAPAGSRTITFSAPNYLSSSTPITFNTSHQTLDVALVPKVEVLAPSPPQLGQTATFTLNSPLDANNIFIVIPSLSTTPGLPLSPTLFLQGNIDALTLLAFNTGFVFPLTGNLDPNGQATIQMIVPDAPLIQGLPIVLNYLTFNDSSTAWARISQPWSGNILP